MIDLRTADPRGGDFTAGPARRLWTSSVSLRALCLGALLGTSLAGAAHAQSADSATVEEVVVTANKRDEKIQDVPAAISALSGEQLGKMGVDSFRDFATSVPGLTFVPTSNTTTKIVLRGISTGNNYDASQSGTGLYLDDVPMSSSYGSGGSEITLVDLERVEVLRGPQGTLYGAGSMGGTVKYVTAKPNPTRFEGLLEAEGASTDGEGAVSLNGVVNVPLVEDKLALRAVVYHRNNSGYISSPTLHDDSVNTSRVNGGRLALGWNVNETWTVTAFGLVQDTHSGGVNYVDTDINKRPLAGDLTQTLSNISTPSTIRSVMGNLVVTGDLGWATLTSSTSKINFKRRQYVDDTPTATGGLIRLFIPGTLSVPETFKTAEDGFVEELRLTSPGDKAFRWVAGVFYQDYTLDSERNLTLLPAKPFGALKGNLIQNRKTWAVFGEATYAFTPQWELTVGGRYAAITNASSQTLVGALVAPTAPTTPISQPEVSRDTTYFTPKVELSFKPTADHLLYALVAQGYRPGGPNLKYPAPVNVPSSFEPDTVWNYEVGAKTAWLDHRLIANLAIYHLDFDKLQVVATYPGTIFPYLANAGKARSNGAELEIQARPSHALSLGLSASYTDAKFTTNAPALGALKGDRIPQVPEWTFAGSLDYRRDLWSGVEGFIHLDGRYVSDSSANTNALARTYNLTLDSYSIANLRVGLDRGNFQASVFVDNITDERAELNILLADAFSPPRLRVTVNQPRTVGIKLSQHF